MRVNSRQTDDETVVKAAKKQEATENQKKPKSGILQYLQGMKALPGLPKSAQTSAAVSSSKKTDRRTLKPNPTMVKRVMSDIRRTNSRVSREQYEGSSEKLRMIESRRRSDREWDRERARRAEYIERGSKKSNPDGGKSVRDQYSTGVTADKMRDMRRPYLCKEDGLRFMFAYELSDHMKKVHGRVIHPCLIKPTPVKK